MTIAIVPDPPVATGVDLPVVNICGSVVAWAEKSEDIGAIRDAASRLAAIDLYLDRTSTDGRAAVAGAMRCLEMRIGQLLGDPRPGERTDLSLASEGSDLTANERSQFRTMAAHPDVVRDVIDGSTDEKPASRRKVITAIRGQETPPDPDPYDRRGEAAQNAALKTIALMANLAVVLEQTANRWHAIPDDELTNVEAWHQEADRLRAALDKFLLRIQPAAAGLRMVR